MFEYENENLLIAEYLKSLGTLMAINNIDIKEAITNYSYVKQLHHIMSKNLIGDIEAICNFCNRVVFSEKMAITTITISEASSSMLDFLNRIHSNIKDKLLDFDEVEYVEYDNNKMLMTFYSAMYNDSALLTVKEEEEFLEQ